MKRGKRLNLILWGFVSLVVLFALLWLLRGTPIIECWRGYACGDAGGWFGGLGAFAAAAVALWLSYDERHESVQQQLSELAGIAASASADVGLPGLLSAKAVAALLEEERPFILSFHRDFYFHGTEALERMRVLYARLPLNVSTDIGTLLGAMLTVNGLAQQRFSAGLREENVIVPRARIDLLRKYGACALFAANAMDGIAGVIQRVEPDAKDKVAKRVAEWRLRYAEAEAAANQIERQLG